MYVSRYILSALWLAILMSLFLVDFNYLIILPWYRYSHSVHIIHSVCVIINYCLSCSCPALFPGLPLPPSPPSPPHSLPPSLTPSLNPYLPALVRLSSQASPSHPLPLPPSSLPPSLTPSLPQLRVFIWLLLIKCSSQMLCARCILGSLIELIYAITVWFGSGPTYIYTYYVRTSCSLSLIIWFDF